MIPRSSVVRPSVLCVGLCLGMALAVVPALGDDEEGAYCLNGQSPRNVDPDGRPSPYELTSHGSIVARVGAGSISYLPRAGGPPQTLYRCGQHYHLPVENPQGCRGETEPVEGETAPPGSWVEIHTVYAANREAPRDCDPETLSCCTEPPFLVRGFSARVTERGEPGPIEVPEGRPLAEWSGSTTGPERNPYECKPAALWSFRLGCEFTVSEAQIRQFKHADPARPVQTGDRLSRDLTLVQP